MNCFKYISHLFKARGGNNSYTAKNNELYNKATILNEAFLSGKRIQIIPTSSSDIFSQFTEKCLYKILINGRTFIEGFRVYNADNEFNQPQQINNNIAQPLPVRNNVNVGNNQNNRFDIDNCGLRLDRIERAKAVFQEFKRSGDLSQMAEIIGIQRVSSFYVDFIVFVKDGNTQKVIKTMGEDAGDEKDHVEEDFNLITEINRLSSINNVKIPKIIVSSAVIDGNGHGAYLQERATGKEFVTFDIKKMADEDIKKMFKAIGQQSGNLDSLLINNNMPFIHHTDSHSKNLFFDAQTQKFSWIDTAGLSYNYNQRQMTTSPEEGSLFTLKVIETFFSNCIMNNEANQEQGPDAGQSIAILNAPEEEFNKYYNNLTPQKITRIKNAIRNGGSYDYNNTAIKEDIKTILSASKKFAIALKSLCEGYILSNPNAKAYLNGRLKSSMVYNYLQYANDLRALIGQQSQLIFNLLLS